MSEFLKYPEEIQKIFLFEQKRQTGVEDINVFIKDYSTSIGQGGFTWSTTLYSTKYKDSDLFRNTVSLRRRIVHNYKEIINFYRREVPGIFEPEKEIIEIDGETFII